MSSSLLTGKDVFNALVDLKMPANLTEIVEHLSANNEGSKTALLDAAKDILNAGVRFGCIVEMDNKYRAEYIDVSNPVTNRKTKDADEETSHHVTNKKNNGSPAVSTDDDEGQELNDNVDDCGSRLRRGKRSRSRSVSKRRRSRRRRRHG